MHPFKLFLIAVCALSLAACSSGDGSTLSDDTDETAGDTGDTGSNTGGGSSDTGDDSTSGDTGGDTGDSGDDSSDDTSDDSGSSADTGGDVNIEGLVSKFTGNTNVYVSGDYLVVEASGIPNHNSPYFEESDPLYEEPHSGMAANSATITDQEKVIIATLAPHLRKLGLHFVGIDIIGDMLVEVNVTSPTGIQEASHFAGERLDDKVIAYVEELVTNKG